MTNLFGQKTHTYPCVIEFHKDFTFNQQLSRNLSWGFTKFLQTSFMETQVWILTSFSPKPWLEFLSKLHKDSTKTSSWNLIADLHKIFTETLCRISKWSFTKFFPFSENSVKMSLPRFSTLCWWEFCEKLCQLVSSQRFADYFVKLREWDSTQFFFWNLSKLLLTNLITKFWWKFLRNLTKMFPEKS